MNSQTGTMCLAIIAILAVFVSIQPILPSNQERFSEFGLLGPNQTISGYPTQVRVGQQFHLFGYIKNDEERVTFYQVVVKLGNESTVISNSTFARAPQITSYTQVLGNNQSWIYPISLSLNQTGTNQRLIFELWTYNTTAGFTYSGLWNQLWINVTRG